MTFGVYFSLSVLAALMMWYTNRYYHIPLWKLAVASIFLGFAGIFGAKLMGFIEHNGIWKGRSFFGSVFLIPLVMYPVTKALKVPYGDFMDLVAPAGCFMLIALKIKCKIDGCCYGLKMQIGDFSFRFPSQIAECIAALILTVVMLLIIKKGRWRGYVYAWCMLLYGCSRFILNLFRETDSWIGPLSQGCFWSLISILIGATFLVFGKSKIQKARKK